MLEYPMKSGILELQRRGNLADSDPRLQVLMRALQGVTPGGTATVSETVSKPAVVTTIRHYLSELARTRVHNKRRNRTGFSIQRITYEKIDALAILGKLTLINEMKDRP